MEPTRRIAAAAVPAALLVTLACEAEKSANPLSPSVAGPIAGVQITAPRMIEPSPGARYKESQQPIRLSVENASSNGVRPLYYTFEVASDSSFQTKAFARSQVPPGPDGRTSVHIDRLEHGRSYYWRARAEDGANTGPFVSAQFEVLPQPIILPPTALSPANNQRVSSRRPTLTAGPASRNAGVGALSLEFQIARDVAFGQMAASGIVPELVVGGDNTFIPAADLAADAQHYWRVRASDGETTSGWSATQPFLTPAGGTPPGPTPGPSPGPGAGGSCASNNGPFIASCISAKYPDRLRPVGSLAERQRNMEFLRDRMIEAGKCGGMDLGWNLKRGGPELSIDFLVHRTGGQDIGIDIGIDYDNISTPLVLVWGVHGPGAFYLAYPNTPCQ